jgi:hypothetical protein
MIQKRPSALAVFLILLIFEIFDSFSPPPKHNTLPPLTHSIKPPILIQLPSPTKPPHLTINTYQLTTHTHSTTFTNKTTASQMQIIT